jgi:hypothetical protein
MRYQRSTLLVIAAALFLPPLVLPIATAKAQSTATVTAAPRIERFDLDPPERLMPGEALIFRITGTPRANASVSIEGLNHKVALREVMPGIYEGAYTIKAGDQINVSSGVTGNLRRGHLELNTALNRPLVETSAFAATR